MAFSLDQVLRSSGVMVPGDYQSASEDIESKRQAAIAPVIGRVKDRTAQSDKLADDVSAVKTPDKPKVGDLPEAPEQAYRDTTQALGGMGSLLAVIGSLATRAPLTAGLNAVAASMKGFHEGDKEKLKLESDNWKKHFDKALKQNDEELKQYEEALKSSDFDLTKAQAKMHAIAAANQDDNMPGRARIRQLRAAATDSGPAAVDEREDCRYDDAARRARGNARGAGTRTLGSAGRAERNRQDAHGRDDRGRRCWWNRGPGGGHDCQLPDGAAIGLCHALAVGAGRHVKSSATGPGLRRDAIRAEIQGDARLWHRQAAGSRSTRSMWPWRTWTRSNS